ncbi:polysaccharide export protein [Shewanella sp. 5_MG-2023]|uniref:polysaccharide export protein n=1 Tax=Shewanella sp. 5_MG-2023 TaxID=3062656 RepID=UPI0026E190A2|nr:polysaccharide export protein [Shewanella sp. 5_MG-2023]MDO6639198.1 polysaccharide export protein [Shewanella sp. 5_MG-2023]
MMLQKWSKLSRLLIITAPLLLAGCAIPGSNITSDGKNVISTNENVDLTQVNVYALTPSTINQFKSKPVISQNNPVLESAIASYEYLIGVGDVLNITIWDHPELTIPAGSYRSATDSGNWVHADGTIYYPYIGNVSVAGRTVREVRTEITQRLTKYIESPQVDVSLAAFRSKKAYITGEVSKPGQLPLTNIPLTILDAVSFVGGLSADADWRDVSLTRKGETESLSLFALMQKGDLQQNRLLQDGDIVHIPRNDNQKVFVLGEVKDPKLLKIDRLGMSLTEALSEVGGINEFQADATGVFVIRSRNSENNNEMLADIFQLDISDATALAMGTEFELQPYDVVYVTAAPISRWNRILSQLMPTIAGFNELTEGALRVRNW